MSDASLSTIAQLVCSLETPVNFARLVGDLDAVLSRFNDTRLQVTWDCEDIAIFDMPGTRIMLGWSEDTGRGCSCLSVAVGPSPIPPVPGSREGNDALCVRLVERVQPRLNPRAVIWTQVEGLIASDTIDDLSDTLPRLDRADRLYEERAAKAARPVEVEEPVEAAPIAPNVVTEEVEQMAEPVSATIIELPPQRSKAGRLPNVRRPRINVASAAQRAKAPAAKAATANDRPDMPRLHDPELGRLREALYAPAQTMPDTTEEDRPSDQMRLAIHAMNATLIVVYAPLGVAVMTYTLLKGEDLKLSARLMLLVGSFAMMAQTPIGQTVAALAGI